MTGPELRAIRLRHRWRQQDVADALNPLMGRKYNADTIRKWEKGERNLPDQVAAFIEEISVKASLEGAGRPLIDDHDPPLDDHDLDDRGVIDDDTPPGPGPGAAVQAPFGSLSGAYVKACTELWEMIASGVGMIGAATGSRALMQDGAIIDADKQALGQAWGKLAETNDTFRKMLVSMTEGGAWLQVALVTGTTVSRCWQGHAITAAQERAQASGNGHVDAEPTAAAA